MHKITLIALVSIGIFLTSCEEDPDTPPVVLPTNLEVDLIQSEDNPAIIEIQASADNVNFYRFSFGDDSESIEQKSGNATHQYSVPGEYQITVSAHASGADYISETETVTIPEPELGDIIPAEGYVSPESYEGMTMVWNDEFDGESLNLDDWTYEIGNGANGWGNNELEYYTDENTSFVNGNLVITAKEQSRGGFDYTSSRIITKGKQAFQYGRVDIRAVLPYGQGIWPALWMLGENIDEVGWPRCGEIDIMEMIGGTNRDNTVHGTVHWQSNNGYANYGGHTTLSSGIFADEFHVYSIIWSESSITWLLDGEQFHIIDLTPEHLSEFRNDFFFIFNVAVGGNWPGSPNQQTTFPQYMIVDYIRVFQPE